MTQPLPFACQRCAHVAHSVGPTQLHRWTCRLGLHMQAPCPNHSPLADGREAQPVLEVQP